MNKSSFSLIMLWHVERCLLVEADTLRLYESTHRLGHKLNFQRHLERMCRNASVTGVIVIQEMSFIPLVSIADGAGRS